MNEPWFNANEWSWLPGTALGCLAGLWGAAGGVLAERGRAPRLILGSGLLLAVLAFASLAAGVCALAVGQPYGVWYGLMLPGSTAVLVAVLLPVVFKRYRAAEARRMRAEDFV